MTTIREKCPIADSLSKDIAWDLGVLKDKIGLKREDLADVLVTLSGVGALYNIGRDWAHLNRFEEALVNIEDTASSAEAQLSETGIPPEASRLCSDVADRSFRIFNEEWTHARNSIRAKAIYVISAGAAITGAIYSTPLLGIGLLGAIGSATYSLMNAAYNTTSEYTGSRSYVESTKAVLSRFDQILDTAI